MNIPTQLKLDSALEVLDVCFKGILDEKMLRLQSPGADLNGTHPRGGGYADPGHGGAPLQVDNVRQGLLSRGDRDCHHSCHTFELVLLEAGLDPLNPGR